MAPPSTSDQFPSSDMFDYLIRIEVGTDEDTQSFDVYHGILCFYSGFFKTALNGCWKESEDRLVRLPEDDPQLVKLFTHWIHTRCFFQSTLDPSKLMSFATLAKMWVLADVLEIPMLQNEAVNVILKKMKHSKKSMAAEEIEYIFENTSECSPLRRLVSESIQIFTWDASDPDDWFGEIHCSHDITNVTRVLDWEKFKEFRDSHEIEDRLQLSRAFKDSDAFTDRCQWHVHSDGVTCVISSDA